MFRWQIPLLLERSLFPTVQNRGWYPMWERCIFPWLRQILIFMLLSAQAYCVGFLLFSFCFFPLLFSFLSFFSRGGLVWWSSCSLQWIGNDKRMKWHFQECWWVCAHQFWLWMTHLWFAVWNGQIGNNLKLGQPIWPVYWTQSLK